MESLYILTLFSSVSALLRHYRLTDLLDGSDLGPLFILKKIEDLVYDFTMFIDACWICCYVISVVATMAEHALLTRTSWCPKMVFTSARNTVVLSPIVPVAHLFSTCESLLDHGHCFTQRIDFNHLLEAISERIIVLLNELSILANLKIELIVLFFTEKLFLYGVFKRFLLSFLF